MRRCEFTLDLTEGCTVPRIKQKWVKEWVCKEIKTDHEPGSIISLFHIVHIIYTLGRRPSKLLTYISPSALHHCTHIKSVSNQVASMIIKGLFFFCCLKTLKISEIMKAQKDFQGIGELMSSSSPLKSMGSSLENVKWHFQNQQDKDIG